MGPTMTDLWSDWNAEVVAPSTLRRGTTDGAEASP